MLQRDITTPDMGASCPASTPVVPPLLTHTTLSCTPDVRWVSALSWYFLNWFALNGVFRLLLSDPSAAKPEPTSTLFLAGLGGALPPGAPAPQGDFPKFFRQEQENLQMAVEGYRYLGEGVEASVRARWAL